MHPFDEGIALDVIDEGRLRGTLDRRWWIDLGPNGGFLASIMLNAMLTATPGERSPRSLSVHYPGRAQQGDFEIEVGIDRAGRSMTFASARMIQGGRLLTTALCTLSDERSTTGFGHLPAPEVAPPEDIPEIVLPPEMLPRFVENFDYRMALGALPYSGANEALIGGWIRPKPGRVVDSLLIPTYSDGFPPAAFSMSDAPFPIPTIDLTVHFRAPLPVDEHERDWCLARFASRVAASGFVEEDGTIWSRDGTVLAQSRQLAIYGKGLGRATFE